MKKFLQSLAALVCIVYLVLISLIAINVSFGGAETTTKIKDILVDSSPYIIGGVGFFGVMGKGVIRIVLMITIILSIALYAIGANTTWLSGLVK